MGDSYGVNIDLTAGTRALGPLQRTKDALKDIGEETDKAQAEVSGLERAFGGLQGAIGGIFAGLTVGAVISFGQQLYETGKSANRAEALFNSFEDRIGSTSDMLERLRTVSRGAVTDFGLMQGANQLLSMGLATNAEELERMTNIAATFAQAMGTDVGDSVNQLALILANQSYERLDALGISSGAVRELKNQYQRAGMDSATAFNTAFMQIAEEKLPEMAAVADQTVTQLDRLRVRFENTFSNMAENFAIGFNALSDAAIVIPQAIVSNAENDAALVQSARDAAAGWAAEFSSAMETSVLNDDVLRGMFEQVGILAARGGLPNDMEAAAQVGRDILRNNYILFPSEEQSRTAEQIARFYAETYYAAANLSEAELSRLHTAGQLRSVYEGIASAFETFRTNAQAALANYPINSIIEEAQAAYNLLEATSEAMFNQSNRGSIGGVQLFTQDEVGAAEAVVTVLDNALERMREMGAEDTALANIQQMADGARNIADEFQRGADALKNMTLAQALGQGADTNELLSGILSNLDLSGLADAQQRVYQQQFGLATGEETQASLMLQNTVIPRLQTLISRGASPQTVINAAVDNENLMRNMRAQGFNDSAIAQAMAMGPAMGSRMYGVSLEDNIGISAQGEDFAASMEDAEETAQRIDTVLSATVAYPKAFSANLDEAFGKTRKLTVDLDVNTAGIKGPLAELIKEIVAANNGSAPGSTTSQGRSTRSAK